MTIHSLSLSLNFTISLAINEIESWNIPKGVCKKNKPYWKIVKIYIERNIIIEREENKNRWWDADSADLLLILTILYVFEWKNKKIVSTSFNIECFLYIFSSTHIQKLGE